MNHTILSLSLSKILDKSPIFTFRGHQFVLAGADMYKSFATVVFSDFQKFVVKKSRFSLFRATPLEAQSSNGNYSNLRCANYINETSSSLTISDCFFMKMVTETDQTPSAVYYAADNGQLHISYSTFLACTSHGPFGVISATCDKGLFEECCFRECYSNQANGILIQGNFTSTFYFNESMTTAANHQINQSSELIAITSDITVSADLLNITGIQTEGTAIFNVYDLFLSFTTFRNISSEKDIISVRNSVQIKESEFSNLIAKITLISSLSDSPSSISLSFFLNNSAPSTANGNFVFDNCTSDKSILINDTYQVEYVSTDAIQEFFLYGMAGQQCLGAEVRDDCYNTTWAMVKYSVAISTWIYAGLVIAATVLFFSVKNKLKQPVDDTVVVEYQSGSEWDEEGEGIREILAEVSDEEGENKEGNKGEPTKETPLLQN